MEDTKRIYNLHFDEANCPYRDDELSEDVYIRANASLEKNLKSVCNRIDGLKGYMDDSFVDDEAYDYNLGLSDAVLTEIAKTLKDEDKDEESNILYDAYWDYGWNDKIDQAIRIVAIEHPEYEIEILDDIIRYETRIN